MSASVGDPTESPPAIDPERPARPRRNPRDVVEPRAPDVHEICPYLAAAGGAWRSSSPHREHRCGAVEPPAALSSEKQRRLCLSVDHASCQTFRAARASRAAMLAPGVDPAAVAAADAARRPVARSSAIILEHPRLSAPRARWPVDRAMSQVVLVGLMIVAVLALAIARLPGPGVAAVAGPSATVSPTASPTVRPTARPTLRPSPSAAASASAPASPSAAPSGIVSGVTATPTPAPSAGEIYVVKKGDTLYGIASQFGTTVAAVKSLNNLTSNDLKIGQKLQIPE